MTRTIRLTIACVALILGAAACGDDAAEPIFTTTTTAGASSTSTAAPSATASPTTTGVTTTTVATTTTTTSTPSTTTTTTTAPPPPQVIFEPDGIGIAHFGDDPTVVLDQLTAIFGASTLDTGWIAGGFGDYGVCPGTNFRHVEFDGGDFVVQFADGDHFGPAGTRVFYYYAWYGGAPGPTPGPPASIDAGTTVQTLKTIWPSVEIYDDDPFFGYTYRVSGSGWNQLWGRLTGVSDSDQISSVSGGLGCGE